MLHYYARDKPYCCTPLEFNPSLFKVQPVIEAKNKSNEVLTSCYGYYNMVSLQAKLRRTRRLPLIVPVPPPANPRVDRDLRAERRNALREDLSRSNSDVSEISNGIGPTDTIEQEFIENLVNHGNAATEASSGVEEDGVEDATILGEESDIFDDVLESPGVIIDSLDGAKTSKEPGPLDVAQDSTTAPDLGDSSPEPETTVIRGKHYIRCDLCTDEKLYEMVYGLTVHLRIKHGKRKTVAVLPVSTPTVARSKRKVQKKKTVKSNEAAENPVPEAQAAPLEGEGL